MRGVTRDQGRYDCQEDDDGEYGDDGRNAPFHNKSRHLTLLEEREPVPVFLRSPERASSRHGRLLLPLWPCHRDHVTRK
jgi:hypothetical protein